MGSYLHRWLKGAGQLARAFIHRPLRKDELAAALALILVLGTIYCGAYCRIAYYPMHEGAMPLWLSGWWAGTTLLPWLIAFETAKRLASRIESWPAKLAGFCALAGLTAVLTIAANHFGSLEMLRMHRSAWPTLLANQMLPVLLFAALVGLWATEQSTEMRARSLNNWERESLPALSSIEWIRAAGNYVEVKCGVRLLIRRMTMRSAEEATNTADFIRIHRSVIVRKGSIIGFVGPRRSQVELVSGEVMPVGDSYRRAVERLVPSSPVPSLRPINL